MANRTKQRAKSRSAQMQTQDSFQNLISRVGQGTANQASGGGYGFTPISRNRVTLEYAYRSSWIAGKAVDAFAEDMTREGIEVKCDLEPEDLENLENQITALGIWDRIKSNAKWSRLYGGSIAVLMIDGQDPSTPINFNTIRRNQFKGLLVLDRWVVQPSLTELVEEFNMHLGQPKFYDVIADAQGMVGQRIHYSRVIRLDGVELPYWQRIAENGWGQSILERLWDRLLAFDSTTEGAAQLVYKAHLRTYGVDGLREIIAAGGKAMEGLTKQIDLIRAYQSNEGLTLMDAKDQFQTHAYSFAGLSDMLIQFGQQLSGAMDIPLVRLFGQSPAGLNSTGESDLRTYYDNIKQQQESKLREGIHKIYRAAFPSVLGVELPEDFNFVFKSLWQIDDTAKAGIASTVTTAVVSAFESGIIDRHTALKELHASSEISGIYSNITAEDIKAAEDEPPPNVNEEDPAGIPGQDPTKTTDADFKEEDHPRRKDGKFGSGGGSGESGTKKESKPKQSFKMGGIDKHGNERAPGLNNRERKLESGFYHAMRKNQDGLIEAYHAKNGNVIDPDAVKGLNPHFAADPDLARAVHEPSSKLTKIIYSKALEKKAAAGDKSPTIFTAGGSGSGKSATSPMAKELFGAKEDALTYDSTLSSMKSATARIDEALSKTEGDVGIVYTNTPLEFAMTLNLKRTRSVSIDTLIHAHHGASKTIKDLQKHYADNPRVNILVMNNSPEFVGAGTVKDVPNYEVFNMRERLVRQAKELLEKNKITQAKYNLLVR